MTKERIRLMKQKASLAMLIAVATLLTSSFAFVVPTNAEPEPQYSYEGLPWFYVYPSNVILGPGPSIGELFTVGVGITGLNASWHIVGFNFRLFFNDTIITPVNIVEGPFLKEGPWNLYGTFFYGSYELDGLGPHVLVGTLLLPNDNGAHDQTVFPNGEGIIAWITFKAIKQESTTSLECDLIIGSVYGEYLITPSDGYGPSILNNDNGHYKILATPHVQVNIHMSSLSLNSALESVAAYIEFPDDYSGTILDAIDPSTVLLNGTVPIDMSAAAFRGDVDNDKIPDLRVNFNRTMVSEYIRSQGVAFGNVTLTVIGQLNDGTWFKGVTLVGVRILAGDANCDGKVDAKDVMLVALAFGECPCRPRWNPFADLNEDNKADIRDYYQVCINFGKTPA